MIPSKPSRQRFSRRSFPLAANFGRPATRFSNGLIAQSAVCFQIVERVVGDRLLESEQVVSVARFAKLVDLRLGKVLIFLYFKITEMNSKLPNTKTSIFAVMSQMANENNAINLSQGFPDFDVAPKLIELVNKNMNLGHNQYAPMPGIMPLREIISEKTEQISGKYYNPETEITITSGATQALYTTITALIHEGDEVIVFEPV